MPSMSLFASTVDGKGCEEIAEAVSGTFTDEPAENEFSKELQQLSNFLLDLLRFLLTTHDKLELVEAYFECYKQILNFEYKGKYDYYATLNVRLIVYGCMVLLNAYRIDSSCALWE